MARVVTALVLFVIAPGAIGWLTLPNGWKLGLVVPSAVVAVAAMTVLAVTIEWICGASPRDYVARERRK